MSEPDDFDTFWAAYPRKQAKGDARKAWIQTARIRPSMDELLKSISDACRSDQWQENSGKYIPLPASWLRGERWCDEWVISTKPKLPLFNAAPSAGKPDQEQIQKVREMLNTTGIRRVA